MADLNRDGDLDLIAGNVAQQNAVFFNQGDGKSYREVPFGDGSDCKAAIDARAQAFIALPGGFGTLEELTEILSLRKLGKHHRPLVLLDKDGFYDGFTAQILRSVEEHFDPAKSLDYFRVAVEARDAVDLCEESIRD